MSDLIITSKDNAAAKRARMVRVGKNRDMIFIEGLRLTEEAMQAGIRFEDVFFTERFARNERGAGLLEQLRQTDARVSRLSDDLMQSISDFTTPPGIVAIAARPRTTELPSPTDGALVVILHHLNTPSNAGAIMRTAEAAGVTGVIVTKDSADIFSTKALRGSMGAVFRLKLWCGPSFEQAIEWCRSNRIGSVCADVDASRTHDSIDWQQSRALVMGSEVEGLSADELALTDDRVRIPMREPVESLNVAVAAAIILYEAVRQRRGIHELIQNRER